MDSEQEPRGTDAAVPSGPVDNSLAPGEYRFSAQPYGTDAADLYIKLLTYDGVEPPEGFVAIQPGSTPAIGVRVAQGAASLTARVTDHDGKPVPDACIVLIPGNPSSVRALSAAADHGETSPAGTYAWHNLAPGRYKAIAIVQPVRWDVPEDLEKLHLLLFQARDVDLGARENREITLEPIPF